MQSRLRIYMYYIYMTVAFGLFTTALPSSIDEHADKLIKTRKLREAGFESFEVASSHIELQNNERVLPKHLRKRRDLTEQRQTLTLKLNRKKNNATPSILVLEHVTPVLHPDAILKVQSGEFAELLYMQHTDCYLQGHFKEHPERIASFSYCHRLTGIFYDESNTYLVESLDEQTDETEISVDSEHLLIASKPTVTITDDLTPNIDIPNLKPETAKAAEGNEHREARNVPSITIETVVITDMLYTNAMKAKGYTTAQQWVDLMTLKWNAVQAEWGRAGQLGYEVNIEIKEMDFWETNPSFYTASTSLQTTLASICWGADANGLYPDYDHIHLFTGKTGTDVAGKAFLGGICQPLSRCAVSTNTAADEFNIAAHEIGHLFSMIHDYDSECSSYTPAQGTMGNGLYKWTECSVAKFTEKMGETNNVACLSTVNVNTNVVTNLTEAWPGMVYTKDEVCAFKAGPGYRYRSFPYTSAAYGYCGFHSCTNMDTSSAGYGLMVNYATPTSGRYCGDGMACTPYYNSTAAAYQCITLAEIGVDATATTVVIGGWSAWGAETTCSRTCGTGVRYRQRTCTEPKPMNSDGCVGSEYSATLCNTDPCTDDSTTESTLITQRAGETCTNMKSNSLYEMIDQVSTNYENTGTKFNSKAHGQCEVKCNTISGFSAPSNQRFGLMPDGTPCTGDTSSFVETNNLARASGFTYKCVQGYCETFGCDNTTNGVVKDGCGVCGGDNSTCTVVEGVMSTDLAETERVTLIDVPTESFLIQAYFTYSDMQEHYVELHSKDGTAIVATMISGVSRITGNNLDQPYAFAGTYWYYHSTRQYLHADGPLNEAVVIKLYNDDTNNNTGVNYAYSRPLTACATESCENGGTWNTTLCSCDCPTGYYGHSCSSTCDRYCKNNQGTTDSCSCDCTGDTYGSNCNCKYPFQGPGCTECKVTSCQNGGVFNSTACRCNCPAGFGELDCSTVCEDAKGDTASCITDRDRGKCETKNENMEKNCYMTCGLCEYVAPTTTSATTSSTTSTTTATTTTATTTTTTSTAGTTTTTTTGTTTQRRPEAPSAAEASKIPKGVTYRWNRLGETIPTGNLSNPGGTAGRLGPNAILIFTVLPTIVFFKLYRYLLF